MPPWSMKEMLALAPIFDMDVSKVGLLVASTPKRGEGLGFVGAVPLRLVH